MSCSAAERHLNVDCVVHVLVEVDACMGAAAATDKTAVKMTLVITARLQFLGFNGRAGWLIVGDPACRMMMLSNFYSIVVFCRILQLYTEIR